MPRLDTLSYGVLLLVAASHALADPSAEMPLTNAQSSPSAEEMYASLQDMVLNATVAPSCQPSTVLDADIEEIVVCAKRNQGERYRIDRSFEIARPSMKTDVQYERQALLDPNPCDYTFNTVKASCLTGVPLVPIAKKVMSALSSLLSSD